MCKWFLSINLKVMLRVCVYVSSYRHSYVCVCVWKGQYVYVCIYTYRYVCVCVAVDFPVQGSMRAAALTPLLLARIYSGFGSMKYLRAPKTPALTHTCISGLRNKNLPRVLFLQQKSHTPATEPSA